MSFRERLQTFQGKLQEEKFIADILVAERRTDTESLTDCFVKLFLEFIGFDIGSPKQVIPRYKPSYRASSYQSVKGARNYVDYALCREPFVPAFLLVRHSYDVPLHINTPHRHQLARHFANEVSAKLAILTNGFQYLIYSDSSGQKMLDDEPTYTFDLENLKNEDCEVIQELCRHDSTQVVRMVNQLRSLRESRQKLSTY